ncbi:hypothetical protein HDV57DRAFT_132830 [Trichoderma longibrachiatum]
MNCTKILTSTTQNPHLSLSHPPTPHAPTQPTHSPLAGGRLMREKYPFAGCGAIHVSLGRRIPLFFPKQGNRTSKHLDAVEQRALQSRTFHVPGKKQHNGGLTVLVLKQVFISLSPVQDSFFQAGASLPHSNYNILEAGHEMVP